MAKSKAELKVLDGTKQFTRNLYRALARGSQDNIFFSPISVHAVLSMVYQGAQGTTAQAFRSTLHVPNAAVASDGYNSLINRLRDVPNVTLLMANKVYLMEGEYQLINAFNNAITTKFLSEVQSLNFSHTEVAANTINHWVMEQTKDKIQDLIDKDDLDSSTKLVLVNAIYFKGNWKHKFDKNLTTTEPFHLSSAVVVNVKMMHINRKFNYKSDQTLDAQILQLPYNNEDFSMIIILPNKKDGIHDLEMKLETYNNISDITNDLWYAEVNVALPRFKIEQTIDLEASLTKLGLGEIFDQSLANFKGMITAREGLYVSKAIQKACIEVNEEGAEAAAATAMSLVRCSSSIPQNFCTDHPFIILLSFKNSFLFMGRIISP